MNPGDQFGFVAQQIGAGRVPEVIAGELSDELVDQREPRLGALPHGDRDRAVERDDRRWLAARELVEQTGDLPPVRVEPATAEAFAAAEPEAAGNGFAQYQMSADTSTTPTR